MRLTKETYYAMRIGNPEDHYPRFALDAGLETPKLFTSRKKAFAHFVKGYGWKVVRVELRELK